MKDSPAEYALEFLLAFDGHIHHLDEGYWIKFEIKRVRKTRERPHGLSYSFPLHAPGGTRLVGFDNGHGVPATGSRFKRRLPASDHFTGRKPTPAGLTHSGTPILCSRTSFGRFAEF